MSINLSNFFSQLLFVSLFVFSEGYYQLFFIWNMFPRFLIHNFKIDYTLRSYWFVIFEILHLIWIVLIFLILYSQLVFISLKARVMDLAKLYSLLFKANPEQCLVLYLEFDNSWQYLWVENGIVFEKPMSKCWFYYFAKYSDKQIWFDLLLHQ